MHTATSRRRGWRFSRLLAALTALLLVASGSLVATMAAHAAQPGYVGQISGENQTYFDMFGGDRHLGLMTEGVPYSDTLTGPDWPEWRSTWCWRVTGTLPDGITMTSPAESTESATATFAGTPTTAGEEYTFTVELWDCSDGQPFELDFTVIVEAGKSPTTTTLTAPTVGSYAGFTVSATVAGNPDIGHAPTGTVEFYASGTVLVGTGTLVAGVATATASLDKTNAGGLQGITARYLGDADYQASASTSSNVRIFVPVAAGVVTWNGTNVEGATVALLDGTDTSVVIDTDTTNAAGEFALSPGTISTTADVDKLYVLRATLPDNTVIFHKFGGHSITDPASAELTGPKTWKNYINIEYRTPPVWADSTLATPRVGANYSDGVSATSRNAMYYFVSDGELPDDLELDENTGAVTGIPLAEGAYDFEITGNNGFGMVTKRFTGTVGPAGVAPTWDDDELPALRVNVAVDDGVVAVGDPTITYSVTDGTLPAGLVLWPATGAITGTPTTAGSYAFTITAENAFGSVDAIFEGDVEAAPELDLTLDFQPGTSIEDAGSTISAGGLQVGSTYTLTMFSTPRVLFTGTVGASGGFSHLVSLPADTPAGAHKLVLTGTAANGTPMSATAWFSLGTNGKILAISYVGPVGGLAATGAEPGSALFLGGALLLLGVVALAARRRRAAV